MKKKIAAKKGIVNAVTDRRLDFTPGVPLRKSYIIASSARSGSNFLSSLLWHTGVLGAPCEYLNPNFEMHTMMNRLKASSPADYLARLLECRTSRNGIFGLKSHFHNFEAFLKGYPGFLKAIAPVAYVYISREDKVAQAVSMAKAYQTAAWTAAMKGNRRTPRYDRALIAKCLEEIGQQESSWLSGSMPTTSSPFGDLGRRISRPIRRRWLTISLSSSARKTTRRRRCSHLKWRSRATEQRRVGRAVSPRDRRRRGPEPDRRG